MKARFLFLLVLLALLVASCCQYSREGHYRGYLAGQPVDISFSDVACYSGSCCPSYCEADTELWVYPAVPVYGYYYPAPCVRTSPCAVPRERLLIYEPLPFQNPHLIRSPAP